MKRLVYVSGPRGREREKEEGGEGMTCQRKATKETKDERERETDDKYRRKELVCKRNTRENGEGGGVGKGRKKDGEWEGKEDVDKET